MTENVSFQEADGERGFDKGARGSLENYERKSPSFQRRECNPHREMLQKLRSVRNDQKQFY